MARVQKFGFRGMGKVRERLEALGEAVDKGRIYEVVGEAAKIGAAEVRSNATPISREVADSVFSFSKPRGTKHKTALFGVSKDKSIREWVAAYYTKSVTLNGAKTGLASAANRKVSPGGKVAMSLAAMFEKGTSRMPAKPFFAPAIRAAKPAMASALFNGMKALIHEAIASGEAPATKTFKFKVGNTEFSAEVPNE